MKTPQIFIPYCWFNDIDEPSKRCNVRGAIMTDKCIKHQWVAVKNQYETPVIWRCVKCKKEIPIWRNIGLGHRADDDY